MSFVEVLPESELWIGEMRRVTVNGSPVLLLRTERGVYAYADRCPHLGAPLSRGTLQGATLTCSAHHYQFDADGGRGKNPKNVRLTAFLVECRDGRILIDTGHGPEAS